MLLQMALFHSFLWLRVTDVENKLMATKEGRGRGINWKIGIHTTIYKIDN